MRLDLFRFDVTPQVRELVQEVEGAFGKEIPIEFLRPGHPLCRAGGTTKVSEDDIRLLFGKDHSLYSLAHELCHLRRYAKGIPIASPDPTMLKTWTENVENPLEHVAIYPELADMDLGVDPYNQVADRARLHADFPSVLDNTAGTPHASWTISLACVLWHTLLLRSDSVLHAKVEKAVRRANRKAYDLGRKIESIVKNEGVKTSTGKKTAMRKIRSTLQLAGTFLILQVVPLPQSRTNWFRYEQRGSL